MVLPLTWDQMPLTAAQQTAVQSLITWAQASDGSAPPITYSQVKNLRAWIVSLGALVEPGRGAMSRATQFYQNQAIAAFEAANP